MITTLDQSTLCLLATAAFLCCLVKTRFKPSHNMDAQVVKCPLTEQEEKNKVMEASISAITWFEGEFDSTVDAIKKRVEEMVQANPWLLGKIKKVDGRLHLVFDYGESATSVDSIFQTSLFSQL